jgi:putative NADH-flavin reductase
MKEFARMKLLVIGATRGIGCRLVELALDENHHVTVLVRDPEKMPVRHDRLHMIKGDIRDRDAVTSAADDQDAVCITIGINPTRKPVTVFSEGAKTVIEALTHADANQLICVTGIGAGDSKNHGGFFYDRIFNPLLLKTIYEDKERQEALVRNSNLEWVIVRPGFLTNGPLTGTYRVLIDLAGVTAGKISRADVAHFILNEIKEKAYLSKTPLLTY